MKTVVCLLAVWSLAGAAGNLAHLSLLLVNRVIVHVESVAGIVGFCDTAKALGMKPGVC